jgi:hypothetical protein
MENVKKNAIPMKTLDAIVMRNTLLKNLEKSVCKDMRERETNHCRRRWPNWR